jgi:hypothetical protein
LERLLDALLLLLELVLESLRNKINPLFPINSLITPPPQHQDEKLLKTIPCNQHQYETIYIHIISLKISFPKQKTQHCWGVSLNK